MDINEVRKTLEVFRPENELIEIRCFENKFAMSGYFMSDFENLLAKLEPIEKKADACYFTFNEIDGGCYSRKQKEMFMSKQDSTGDGNIIKRKWILIDVDATRASGVSSTKAEKQSAKAVIGRIYKYLSEIGFSEPVAADSGNGYHLLYKVDMPNNNDVRDLLKAFLESLDMMFSDDFARVDTSVFNASRITKLYGTMVRKGSYTEDRPHRLSRILRVPDEIRLTSYVLIKKVADMLPKPEPKSYKNNYNAQFDIRDFIARHNISIEKEVSTGTGTKFVLSECVFDQNHKAPDAAIFLRNDGSIGYKCFHNSCSDYQWHDVRMRFEPNAYENKGYVQENNTPNHKNTEYKPVEVKSLTTATGEPVFYTTEQIRTMKTPPKQFIKTGIEVIDKKMRGLQKGFVTCLTGLRGCGKSSLVSQLANETVEQGFKVALFSGELSAKNTYAWLILQAAGRNYVQETQYENFYQPKPGCEEAVSKWQNEKIYIYNNNYGNEFSKLLEQLNKCVCEKKVDLIILDNLMSIDVGLLDKDKYVQQSKFVELLETFAKANNVHVIFVAHPRKSQGFLRLDDVSGSGDITNRVDNAFIMHRVNNDFKRLTSEHFGKFSDVFDKDVLHNCTNVIEICKDRDGFTQDRFIPLYFDCFSKRLRNNQYENKSYGWTKPRTELDESEGEFDSPPF